MSAGFLVVDKPPGITSHDVVAMIRAVTGIEKVGHTGTLDPFATGVLPLALGGATKLIQFLDESIKVYDATIRLGSKTDTGDPTGVVVEEAPLPTADRAEVEAVLRGFLGDRMQMPPAYSAVKHEGKPLYHYARKGVEVTVEARPVKISGLEILAYDGQELRILITCSRGTYARVLAVEIAQALGSCGHLSALERPRSGPFRLEDAVRMTQLGEIVGGDSGRPWFEVLAPRRKGVAGERVPWRPRADVIDGLRPFLRSPLDVLGHLPRVDIEPGQIARVRQGALLPPPPAGMLVGGRYLVACGPELIGIGELAPRGPLPLRQVDDGGRAA